MSEPTQLQRPDQEPAEQLPGMRGSFDVIVVGAGPAGATAARSLALLGHHVLLLEREQLPRYKPCGGGLGPKSIARLPFPIDDVPHVRLRRIAFRLRSEDPVEWELPPDFPFFMVMRSDLDFLLTKAAARAGAEVRTGRAVRLITWEHGHFLVEAGSDHYRAPYLIGADGATGRVRQSLGLQARKQQGVALECEVEASDDVKARWSDTALFDVEAAPNGYGWIFPKRTHLSVGLGSMKQGKQPLHSLLPSFLERYDLAPPSSLPEHSVHIHPLPIATTREPARLGNALLAGDAAGVADGFGGEGICYAMESGELAAGTVSSALRGDRAALSGYDGELDRQIRHDHSMANWMGRIVRRFPDAGYRILTSLGEGKSVLLPLLMGQIGFGEALQRLPRLLVLDASPEPEIE